MIIFNNDEEKRSKAFIIITVAALIVIVLIGSFFVRKGFTADPLEGSWIYKDGDWQMTFDGSGGLTIVTVDEFAGCEVSIPMEYSLSRENKMVAFTLDSEKFSEVSEEYSEEAAPEDVESFAEGFENTYEYSIDNNVLTLTEGDGGDQMIFEKQ